MKYVKQALEGETLKAILDYLSIKRIFHWRNNSGALETKSGGFVRFGAVGSADVFAIRGGVVYGIEVKSPVGRLSEDQIAFGNGFKEAGGMYVVARSLDDVMEILP